MSQERRSAKRDRSFAHVLLRCQGRLGYVADLSEGGFRGLFPEVFELPERSEAEVEMTFAELNLGPFRLQTLIRWSRVIEGSLEAGFQVLGALDSRALDFFERIRVYYAGFPAPSTPSDILGTGKGNNS